MDRVAGAFSATFRARGRDVDRSARPNWRGPRRPSQLVVLVTALLIGVLAPVVVTDPASANGSLTAVGTVTRTLGGNHMTTGTTEAFSTPAIADVNGDGVPDLVIAGLDGVVEAVRLPSRTRIWQVNVGRTAIQSSPAVADINRDGRADVIVGTMDGRVLWLDGPTGQIRRTFHQGAPMHCPSGVDCRPDGFFATPALADINGDGQLEVIAPSWDHTVYAWSPDGRLLWRRYLEDTLWSSPAVGDIDGDGRLEIVLGGDIWAGSPLGVPAGGLVWVLRHDGTIHPGYPLSVPGQTVWSSPALADINGDGHLDIVVGTGTNWPDPAGRQVRAFTARSLTPIAGWPVTTAGISMASPAIGDLDGDGQLEVAVGSQGGWVYAYDTNGRLMWQTCGVGRCGAGVHTTGSVTIADVDGDGAQEVVAALGSQLQVLNGRTGAVKTTTGLAHGAQPSTPVIGEVNGQTIVARASVTGMDHRVEIFATGRPLCRADWPTFGRDARRTGRFVAEHQRWIPFRCPSGFVARQYNDFLGRPLDQAGSSFWVGRMRSGTTGSTLIRSFMDSPEFGRVVAPVVRLHLVMHGSFPRSADEIRRGAASIRQGTSPAQLAQKRLAGSPLGNLDDRAFVNRVFANAQGRAPSAAEAERALVELAAGKSRGRFVADHAAFAAGRLGAEVDVAMTYLGLLNRAPDADGWAYWVSATRRGGLDRLVSGFQHSAEYRKRAT